MGFSGGIGDGYRRSAGCRSNDLGLGIPEACRPPLVHVGCRNGWLPGLRSWPACRVSVIAGTGRGRDRRFVRSRCSDLFILRGLVLGIAVIGAGRRGFRGFLGRCGMRALPGAIRGLSSGRLLVGIGVCNWRRLVIGVGIVDR
ncbi:hypothetical protein [Mycolicibacterium hippocampi]|uniref:hypothetical protein n=1 Tax=Mycolicibacterium hippocampi TaxID=659824 RepID=UPI0013D558FB|nr:hypothetical protein [Mycolicibacterium hippocampi]